MVKKLLKAIKDAEAVYVATDPDREGEAIAWHLLKLANVPKDKPVYRALFHAITQDAVRGSGRPSARAGREFWSKRSRRGGLWIGWWATWRRRWQRRRWMASSPPGGCRVSACGWWSSANARSTGFTPETFWTLALKLEADGTEFKREAAPHQRRGQHLQDPRTAGQTGRRCCKRRRFWVGKAGRTRQSCAIRCRPSPPHPFSRQPRRVWGCRRKRRWRWRRRSTSRVWITYIAPMACPSRPKRRRQRVTTFAREHGADYLPPTAPTYTVKSGQRPGSA